MKPHNEHQDFFDEIDNLEDLIDDLKIVMQNIATEQSNASIVIKHVDPEAIGKLTQAVEELKSAVESCSLTACKRILDSLDKIMFSQEQDSLLQKLRNQIDDYDFTAAEETLKSLEETLKEPSQP